MIHVNIFFFSLSKKRSTADEKTNFLQEYQTINLDVGINTPKFTEVVSINTLSNYAHHYSNYN